MPQEKNMKKLIIILLLSAFSSMANAAEFKIFTNNGYIGFTAKDHWLVIATQTKPPIAIMAFQIPNKADEGTQDSTNLILSIYTPESEKAQGAIKKIGLAYGSDIPEKRQYKEWAIYKQNAMQGNSTYTIIDAKKNITDVIVGIRVAWPNLEQNDRDYNQRMVSTFNAFLDSVNGKLGSYETRPGEVIRRTIK